MSYRYTFVTDFLYGADPAAVAELLREGLASQEITVAQRYVSGWFKDLSGNDAREWFDGLKLPEGVGLVVLTEWGDVWHRPASKSQAAVA